MQETIKRVGLKVKTTIKRRREESKTHYLTVPAKITMQVDYPFQNMKVTDIVECEQVGEEIHFRKVSKE